MNSHQRIAGLLVGASGACTLLGLGALLLPHAVLHPAQTLRDLTTSVWSLLFLLLMLLAVLWCLLATLGGWRAWRQRADARGPLRLAVLPLLLVFPVGTAVATYTLWAFRSAEAAPLPPR